MITDQIATPLPRIFIDKGTLRRRVNLFLQNKHRILSQAMSSQDVQRVETRSIWYSKDHVQSWLDEMNLMGADGMRVYLGTYEEGMSAGQLCLLMVLTRLGEDDQTHWDIILEDEPGFQERLDASRAITLDEPGEEECGKQYNYGSPCPPICALGQKFGED